MSHRPNFILLYFFWLIWPTDQMEPIQSKIVDVGGRRT